ncbi:ABC transporter ATP-binding protein [Bradyrhizobium sp. 187]|nr:ABC transporter ATP-binding protein [Bradyrhizobium sp. 187]
MLASNILELTGVSSYYGDSQALYEIALSVREGTILGLLGRNGAGKTTCLSTIMGFVKARAGTIRFRGDSLTGLSPESIVRAGIAIVPQGRRVFKSLTVRENLAVAVHSARKLSKASWSMEKVFDLFPRLRERRDQYAGSLSGGEQQMLAIGRALVSNPLLLLMDEPSEGLAPQIVQEVELIIKMLKDDGLSIVLVEQNADLALRLAEDVVMFSTGSVAFSGKAEDVSRRPELIDKHLAVF